jgi:hypothetical protein
MSVVRGALTLLGLSACNWAFGLDPAVPAGLTPPGCAQNLFAAPQALNLTFSGLQYSPAFATLNELWFSSPNTAGSGDFYSTTRSGPAAAFGAVTASAELNTADDEYDIAFDHDGLDVVFVRSGGTGFRILEATRTSLAAPFSPPLELPELLTIDAYGGIALSYDALTLYISDDNHALFTVQRSSPGAGFGAPSPTVLPGASFPAVSPDQLELFVRLDTDMQNLHRFTRATTSDAFGNDTVLFPGDDPYVSPDAQELVSQVGGGLQISVRICK